MSDEAQNGNVTDFAALLAFLDETPNQLANSTSGLSNQELRFQNSPEEFSVLENICHLRDLELQGYTPRIRRILAEADPALADFDGARVAAESNYNNEQPGSALRSVSNRATRKRRGAANTNRRTIEPRRQPCGSGKDYAQTVGRNDV